MYAFGMTAIKPKSNTPNMSDDFMKVAGKNLSSGIDRVQEQYADFFKNHPGINTAIDDFQKNGFSGEGLQKLIKAIVDDFSGSTPAAAAPSTGPITQAPAAAPTTPAPAAPSAP